MVSPNYNGVLELSDKVENLINMLNLFRRQPFNVSCDISNIIKNYAIDYCAVDYYFISACAHDILQLAIFLHQNGANINAQTNMAIERASENGNLNIVQYLCDNGADHTTDDNYPIMISGLNGHNEVHQYLLSLNVPI